MRSEAERISDLEAEVERLRHLVEEVRTLTQPPHYGVHPRRPSHWIPNTVTYPNTTGGQTTVSFSLEYGGGGGSGWDEGGNAGVSEPRRTPPGGGAGGIAANPHISISVTPSENVTSAIRTAADESNEVLLRLIQGGAA